MTRCFSYVFCIRLKHNERLYSMYWLLFWAAWTKFGAQDILIWYGPWGTFYMQVIVVNVKVQQSLYRPWGFQISRQLANEGGKVVSPTHQPPLPRRKYPWYSVLLEAESTLGAIMWLEWLCQWKILLTPSGIKPATFQLVAQCLNELCHCVPWSL